MTLSRRGTESFFRGRTVTVAYDKKFTAEFPHTAALFNGKSGIVVKGADCHGLVEIEILITGINTLIEPRFLN